MKKNIIAIFLFFSLLTSCIQTNKIVIGGYTTRYTTKEKHTFFPISIGENRSDNLSGIEQLQDIISLWITLLDTRDINFSPLKSLPCLQNLTLRGWGLLTIPDLGDIPSLTRLELVSGRLNNINGIEKILLLESLVISENRITLTDMSALRYLSNLKYFHLYVGLYNIDFSVLAELQKLEELWLSGCGEVDLTGIGQIKSMERLYLKSNVSKHIDERSVYKNIEEIGKITGLKELYLDDSITSVEFLLGNVNLEELTIIADEERDDYAKFLLPLDVKPLSNLKKLKRLVIRGFELKNADALDLLLPQLEYFSTDLYEFE